MASQPGVAEVPEEDASPGCALVLLASTPLVLTSAGPDEELVPDVIGSSAPVLPPLEASEAAGAGGASEALQAPRTRVARANNGVEREWSMAGPGARPKVTDYAMAQLGASSDATPQPTAATALPSLSQASARMSSPAQ